MPTVLHWPSVLRTGSLFLFLFLATNCSNASAQSSALNQSTQALYRGDYVEASNLATAHLRRFPNDAPVRVILARAEFAQAEFLQAFVDLRKALASDPKNIDALYYLSLTARELSQRESQRLFSMAPDSDLVHQLLGEAALTANHQSEAEEEFQKALKANPRSIEVLTELAELERSQRKLTEAITYYTQAEELDPLNYDLAYGLGVCYTYTHEYPRAIEWLQKAVRLAPDSADGRFALGRALFHNEQFAAALPELHAALKTEPRKKEAFALLGRAYLKLGRNQEAEAALQRFDELSRAESQNAEARPDAATPPK